MGQLYYYDAGSSSWLPTQVGAQGPQGTQGAQGYQGSVGAQGYQGSVGAQGYQGSVGAQGYQGSVGAQGAANLPASATASVSVTATAGQVTTCNPSSTFAVTLPASPANGTICGVYVLAAATSYVTVAAGSGNTLDYAVGRLYAGQSAYLVYNSTTTSWVSPTQNNQQSNPAGTIYLTATQSVTGGSYFTAAFDTNLYTMKGGMTRINNGLMAPIAGIYNIGFVWSCAVGTNLFLSKNGGAAIQYLNGNANTFSASLNISLVAGDYITLGGFPFTTGAITNGSSGTVMSMYLVSQ